MRGIADGGCIKIGVDRAIPMVRRSVNLTPSYSLEIHGDSILSYLLYFGRAYSALHDGEEGLTFEEMAAKRKQTPERKGNSEIKPRVKTKEDVYMFRMKVYPNSSMIINVTFVNK